MLLEMPFILLRHVQANHGVVVLMVQFCLLKFVDDLGLPLFYLFQVVPLIFQKLLPLFDEYINLL